MQERVYVFLELEPSCQYKNQSAHIQNLLTYSAGSFQSLLPALLLTRERNPRLESSICDHFIIHTQPLWLTEMQSGDFAQASLGFVVYCDGLNENSPHWLLYLISSGWNCLGELRSVTLLEEV